MSHGHTIPASLGACVSCGMHPATIRAYDSPVCELCGFWIRRRQLVLEGPGVFFHTEDWKSYAIGPPDAPERARGYKGPEFLVTFPGRPYAPVYTKNLWCAGEIPALFRANWPGEFSKLKQV